MHTPNQPSPPSQMAPPLTGLGQALRWLREKQTRKQYRVADSAGITKGMLSAYETGRQRPSLDTLEKLLESLGCDLNDLHNALQIVNGRPELIKSWRGWNTTSLLDNRSSANRPLHHVPPLALPLPRSPLNAVAGRDPRTIDEVHQPRSPYNPPGPAAASGAPQPASSTDPQSQDLGPQLYNALGLDRATEPSNIPQEEEQALGQMLEGFHNLLRYFHRTLASRSTPGPDTPNSDH